MIGTGISGLGAAYALSKGHEVELFERDDRAGGHSNTVEHMAAGRTLRLDTGFIVHNEETYPNLVRLFRELGVRTQPSEMSFSVACERHDLEYSGSRPPLTRLTLEIARFLRLGQSRSRRPPVRGLEPRTLRRRGGLLAAVPGSLPRPALRGAVVDRSQPDARLPARLRRPLLREPRDPRLPAPSLEDGHRRQPELRARPRGAAADPPFDRGSVDPPPRRRHRAAARGRRAAPLRRRRGRDPRRPGTAPARGSERGRAPPARRLRDDRERHRPPHRRALPASPHRHPRLLELPASRLRLRRRHVRR